MKILILFRACDGVATLHPNTGRPFGLTKPQIARACFNSLLNNIENVKTHRADLESSFKIIAICDKVSPENEALYRQHGEVIILSNGGNSNSATLAVKLAFSHINDFDAFYFLEDDYMHTRKDALVAAVTLFKSSKVSKSKVYTANHESNGLMLTPYCEEKHLTKNTISTDYTWVYTKDSFFTFMLAKETLTNPTLAQNLLFAASLPWVGDGEWAESSVTDKYDDPRRVTCLSLKGHMAWHAHPVYPTGHDVETLFKTFA